MWRSLLSNAEGGIDLKYVIQDFKPDMFQQILASPPQKKKCLDCPFLCLYRLYYRGFECFNT